MGNQERSAARLNYLMERYRTNTCTRAEMDELFLQLRKGDGSGLLRNLQHQWDKARETAPADRQSASKGPRQRYIEGFLSNATHFAYAAFPGY